MMNNKNIILVGMPGAGKSTLGVLLAKALGMDFLDSDIVIQQREKRLLQEIINEEGIDNFLLCEEKAILSIDCRNTVIATGGSAVYSQKAMEHLMKNGTVLYISLGYDEIKKRLTDISTRGVVLKAGYSLYDTFNERLPLYEKYANITLDCSNKGIEECVETAVDKIVKNL